MLFVTTTITRTVNMESYNETITDANNLYEAVQKSVANSKWKQKSQTALNDILTIVFDLSNELINQTYESQCDNRFSISERGRVRNIESYNVQDRAVRHVLCDKIFSPKIHEKIIYDNAASVTGRGISHARKRFEVHLRRYYMRHGSNKGYILFGDFSKYYDNILHSQAKESLLELVDYDEYISWLLDVIFKAFEVDCSDNTDEEVEEFYNGVFNKNFYVEPETKGLRYLKKSISIGDQLSQNIGIWYPHEIDNYVKIVRSQKYYGRYMDDWYLISDNKEELLDIYDDIKQIANKLGIHVNKKKTHITKLEKRYMYLQVKYTLTQTGKVIKRINPKRVTAMRRRLKKLKKKVESSEVDYINVENTFKAWMGSFYKLLSVAQRNGLVQLYERLFDKHIAIDSGKMIIT